MTLTLTETLFRLIQVEGHAAVKAALNEAVDMLPKKKVVINTDFGGYSFSPEGYAWMVERGYEPTDNDGHDYNYFKPRRDHPLAVRCVEELGERANGRSASLSVVLVPEGVEWYIDEYDGIEGVDW